MPIPITPLSPPPKYQSPPGSGGNDGALPTTYDPAWQTYTNLTQAQIAAFAHFPQDLLIYAHQRRWEAQITILQPPTLPTSQGIGQAVSAFTALLNAHRQLLTTIGSSVNTRKAIDAIYGPIAPNSSSAKNPSSI